MAELETARTAGTLADAELLADVRELVRRVERGDQLRPRAARHHRRRPLPEHERQGHPGTDRARGTALRSESAGPQSVLARPSRLGLMGREKQAAAIRNGIDSTI